MYIIILCCVGNPAVMLYFNPSITAASELVQSSIVFYWIKIMFFSINVSYFGIYVL